MSWIYKQCSHKWGLERYPQESWHGLQVFAVDGALYRTHDDDELREHFGSGNPTTNRQTPFPMLRLVTLMNDRSHVIVDGAISPYRKGEILLAKSLMKQLPNNCVTLLDKGFYGADLLLGINKQKITVIG